MREPPYWFRSLCVASSFIDRATMFFNSLLVATLNASTSGSFDFVLFKPSDLGRIGGKAGEPQGAVRQDNISKLFTVVAMLELVFFTTFTGALQIASVIAAVILIAGLVMQRYFGFTSDDAYDDRKEDQKILLYSVVGIATLLAVNTVVSHVPLAVESSLPTAGGIQSKMFLLLIAVAEEQMFRGFLLNLFITKVGAGPAILADAVVFVTYHAFVYGDNPNALAIVFAGGLVLSFIDWKTGRVSTSIISHVLNNLIA